MVVLNIIESKPLNSPALCPKKSENIVVADVQVHHSQNESNNGPKDSENVMVADAQINCSQNESEVRPRAQAFTSLMADLRQYINRVWGVFSVQSCRIFAFLNLHTLRAQSFTSLEAELHQDINSAFELSR